MTSIRKIGSTNIANSMVVQQPVPGTEAAIEGDSNADTCCLGKNFVILEYTTILTKTNCHCYGIQIWDNPLTMTGDYLGSTKVYLPTSAPTNQESHLKVIRTQLMPS